MFSLHGQEKERGYQPKAKEVSLKHQHEVETSLDIPFAVQKQTLYYLRFSPILSSPED